MKSYWKFFLFTWLWGFFHFEPWIKLGKSLRSLSKLIGFTQQQFLNKTSAYSMWQKKWQFHKLKMYSFLPVLKLMKTFSFFQVSSLFTIYRLRMASSFTISTCVWVQRALSYINFGPFVLMSIWYIFVQFWKGKTTKRSQETYPKHLEFCQSEQKNVS